LKTFELFCRDNCTTGPLDWSKLQITLYSTKSS
jgi:hypothetical protein